jgi:YidC/Oxa1 family membrane protein insertase
MDRRYLIAILLTALVVLIIPRIFPTPKPRRAPTARGADSAAAARAADSTVAPDTRAPDTLARAAGAPSITARAGAGQPADTVAGAALAPPETVTVTTPLATYRFSTVGAMPVQVALARYKSHVRRGERVQIARPATPLFRFGLVTGTDTIRLDHMPFAVDSAAGTGAGRAPLTFRAPIGPAAQAVIRYAIAPDDYLVRVSGEVTGLAGAQLLVTIPNGPRSEEADTLGDLRNLAYVLKPARDEARSVAFARLDTLRAQTETDGPYTWVATKNKYFLVALLTPAGGQPFTGVKLIPAPRAKRALAKDAAATVTRPLGADGRFAFELYAGPQEWRRLHALGRDFEHVNPYGGWFKTVVQPFATAVMRLLLWMHDRLKMSYGWVLVIFGIGVRLALWPLNQSAMRNSLKMQRLQPEMQEIQKKYRNDPQKQQQALMALYKAHNMSPLSPVLGCLPMLIPMPFLFALFFVFQNTIEFRGVPFLWLSDISQKDPYYILPLIMGVSMYLLSWIGLRNSPPNPQAKMMSYMMPAVMTFALLRLAAGLNLYYAVQNFAALPQQWLIARERAKATPPPAAKPAAKPPPAAQKKPEPPPIENSGPLEFTPEPKKPEEKK